MRLLLLPEGPTPWSEALQEDLGGTWTTLSPPPTLFKAWMRAAGTSAPRRIRARLDWRRWVGRWAAGRLPPELELIAAPSLAARRPFAAAQAQGAQCVLAEDLPDLRRLAAELDQAVAAHPDAPLLRRHRPEPARIATQEAERVLAQRVLVGARDRVVAGVDCSALRWAPQPVVPPSPSSRSLLLAGVPVARSGTFEALRALSELPELELLIRPAEAVEPPGLLRHPRVRLARPQELALEGIAAVIAPSWVQVQLPVLDRAQRSGIPVIATRRAAGWLELPAQATLQAPSAPELQRAVAACVPACNCSGHDPAPPPG